MQDTLEKLARLIRQQPDITVRNLADHMGYSETKSIYYWLRKAGFAGMRAFRNAVLRGDYPVLPSVREHETPRPVGFGLDLPLIERLGPNGRIIPGDRTYPLPWDQELVQKLFVYRWPGARVDDLVNPGDALIVEPCTAVHQGDLVLIQDHMTGAELRRIFEVANGSYAMDVVHGEHLTPLSNLVMIGRVRGILRIL